jgi:hypothetical protein
MTDEEHIDEILNGFVPGNSSQTLKHEYYKRASIEPIHGHQLVDFMVSVGLLKENQNGYYMVDVFGVQIKKRGGWVKHLEREETKRAAEEEKERVSEQRKEREDERTRWQTKLAKWQVESFWWVFWGGAIGGLCGIISLSLELDSRYWHKPQPSQQQTQIDRGGTLAKTKTDDSSRTKPILKKP